tara:strand:+ start:210 stop:494 length:285 start_codon:yes stop_codon:yes gene_type:complete
MFYKKSDYQLMGYEKAKNTKKKYDGILKRKSDKKIIRVPFGAVGYGNYSDNSGLNLYKGTGNKTKRDAYLARHKNDIKEGYYSPGFFSIRIFWS